MTKPDPSVLGLPLQQRIELAAHATYAKLVDDRRRTGYPLVVQRNGCVVHLRPSPLPVDQWEEMDPSEIAR